MTTVAAGAGPINGQSGLDAPQFANALRAGIYRVFEQTDHLNKINVFPVPDGDTGTNLAMTLSAVLGALERAPESDAGRLLVRVADAALDGARGNSGSILAQFLLGLADHAGQSPTLDAARFAMAAATGAAYARDAMSQPREGTLLSVMRDFAEELQRRTRDRPTASLPEILGATLPRVRSALAATTGQLEALRDAHVVDAGAQGFVILLEGIAHYLATGETGAVTAVPRHAPTDEAMADGAFAETRPNLQAADLRYCTECLVTAPAGSSLDLRRLREGLSALGGSLVVGGSKTKAKVHLHTDEPERAFEFVESFGTLSGQKVDDMRRQQDAAHHRRTQRVAVVTDSAADIPEDMIDELGIHVVPIRIHFGNRSYLDKVTMTPAEFYRELERNPAHPKTSQPPPGDFRRMYEFLASHFESVVSVSLSAKTSGTHDAALSAAQRVATARDGTPVVTIVDSLSVSCGQALVAMAAARRAREGGSAAQVIEAAENARRHTRAFALLRNVDAAVKGGRVPRFAKTIADLLGLSLILATQPDGRVTPAGVLWGRRRLLQRFAHHVAKRSGEPARRPGPTSSDVVAPHLRLIVAHGNSPEEGASLLGEMQAALPAGAVEWSTVTDLGTALGVHGGPGALVIALQHSPTAAVMHAG